MSPVPPRSGRARGYAGVAAIADPMTPPAAGLPAAPVAFSAEQLAEVRRLQALYPNPRGALLPVLHMAQEAFGGYISLRPRSMWRGCSLSRRPMCTLGGHLLHAVLPRAQPGRHVVAVCHNLSCHLAGAPGLLAHLRERLGIAVGETMHDGRVTLLAVECLCACEHTVRLHRRDRRRPEQGRTEGDPLPLEARRISGGPDRAPGRPV